MKEVCETTLETFVGSDKVVHLVLVSGCNDHELASVVLHPCQQGLESFLAFRVGTLSCRIDRSYGICLVKEQYAAHGLIDSIVHILVGTVDISADYILRRLFNDLVCRCESECLEKFAQFACDCGLSCSRITGQHYVDRSKGCLSYTELHSLLLSEEVVSDFLYGILDACHSDEFVEFLHDVIH